MQPIRHIEAKTILSRLKSRDIIFGITYNMNLYRGCMHGCIYCDTRNDCYKVGDISNVAVKGNSIELLKKELSLKKEKATVGTGSMNDPYMPAENTLGIVRKALKILAERHFPVHIITKSDLVLRDADILSDISSIYAAVSLTITTAKDDLSLKIEPNAPCSSIRFKTVESLAKRGIYTGITLMPVLPFINDNIENIENLMKYASDSGAKYIIPYFGVTLRKGSREYFYSSLDKIGSDLSGMYENYYGDRYECLSPKYKDLVETFKYLSNKYKIAGKIKFYESPVTNQLSLF